MSNTDPQPLLQWYYYDPAQHFRHSFPLNLPVPALHPQAIVTDPMEHILASLKVLQSQFTTVHESLDILKSDVRDSVSQLHALRTAQNKTDKHLAQLGGVIGVADTRENSRGRRAGGTHTEPLLDSDAVPERTLFQSMASIQSVIEELLARPSHARSCLFPPSVSKYESTPIPPCLPLARQESSHTLQFIDPSQQSSPLQSIHSHSVPATSPTSQSDPSSHSSLISTLASHAASRKEYAQASVQACPPSYPQRHAPGFMPVDRSVDRATVVQSASILARPTSQAAERLDTNHSSATTDRQTSQRYNDCPLIGSTTAYTTISTLSVSPETSQPCSIMASSSDPATQSLSSLPSVPTINKSLQTPSPTAEAIGSSLVMRPSADQQMSITSLSNSMTSIGNTPILASTVFEEPPVQPHAELGPDQTISGVDSGAISVTAGVNNFATAPKPAPLAYCRHAAPVEPDDEALPSSLPTPPSDTVTEDHELRKVGRPASEHRRVAGRDSSTDLPRNLPILPSGTQQPSVQEKRGMLSGVHLPDQQGTVGVAAGTLSPLTPSSSQSEEGIELSIPTVDSGVCLTKEPPWSVAGCNPNDDSSPIPQIAEGANVLTTPKFSAGKANNNLSEIQPHVDGVIPPYSQADGYDLQFSSLCRCPSPTPSATPSRYATPSDASNSHRTQEEEEVWGALTLGPSGVPTPVSDNASLPLMLSHHGSRASPALPQSSQNLSASTSASEPKSFAVGPSLLHDLLLVPRISKLQHPPQGSDSPLSSLTSFRDTGREDDERLAKTLRSNLVSNDRAASEVTTVGGRASSRPSGGPGASLSELAMLARREPLKIHLRLPQSLKRKRDIAEGDMVGTHCVSQEGGQALPAEVSANGTISRAEPVTPAPSTIRRTARRLAQESSTSKGFAADAGESPGITSYCSVPRKRTKKISEHGGKKPSGRASLGQKDKSKREPKTKSKLSTSLKYHIWNGQIVSVELEPYPTLTPQPSAISSVSQPTVCAEETGQGLQSPARRCRQKGQETLPASHSTRAVNPSPTKEEVWNNICQGGSEWPELPAAFSDWEIQFIQCDNCDKWYHYGCAGIGCEDPRLQPDTLFICTNCHTQSARRQTARHNDATCARSDCPSTQITTDSDMYYVEKLTGRKKVDGDCYLWLAKWEGYPMSQATWIPKENMNGNGTRLFDSFAEDAYEEGADLDEDVVLLQEAVEAGWDG